MAAERKAWFAKQYAIDKVVLDALGGDNTGDAGQEAIRDMEILFRLVKKPSSPAIQLPTIPWTGQVYTRKTAHPRTHTAMLLDNAHFLKNAGKAAGGYWRADDEQAEEHFLSLIHESVTALFPNLMERLHRLSIAMQ